MELIVQQKGFGANFEYSFFDGDNLVFKANANRTVIPLPRNIFVYDSSGQEICSIRQTTKELVFDSSIDTKLAVILTVLVDITWYTYDTGYTSLSWERSYQVGGRKKDEEWIPKD